MEILVLSIFFIIISLVTSVYAYRGAFFQSLRSTICLDDKYVNKSKNELIKEITEYRINAIKNNKKILKQRATWMHISLNNLVIGIILVAIFIILNIAHSTGIITALLLAVLITALMYKIETRNSEKVGTKK
jgi:hypothetical protein